MLIHSHLPYDQSTSHARIPAGGINLIASIDSVSEAQFTASFFGSTKALHGEVATTSPATTTHNHSNQQYSITAITTSAGAIAERYAYSAYGEPTILDGSGSTLSSSSISNRYSYTGREWDATVGLYHFRARWMSPKTGRFLGRDPIGFEGSEWGLYEFVDGEALNGTDPSGLATISCNCMCRGGRSIGTWFKDVEVECNGLASTCCSSACGKCKFTGEFKLPEAEDDDLGIDELVIDAVDGVVCTMFIVCDVVTVPSGEGAAGCIASKTICRQVKQCIKKKKKPGRKPRDKDCTCTCPLMGSPPPHCPSSYSYTTKGKCNQAKHADAVRRANADAGADGCNNPSKGYRIKHCKCF